MIDKSAGSSMVEQLAFPQADGGSIPTSALQYNIRQIEKGLAANVYIKHHYLGDKGFLHSFSFGAFHDSIVWGAITFSIPNAREINGLYKQDEQSEVYEISRLAFDDDCPKNSESRLIGISIRILRKIVPVRLIISYADTAQGHTGVIYKATGFECRGLTAPKTDFVHPDGKIRKMKGVRYRDLEGEWVKRSRKWLFVKRY